MRLASMSRLPTLAEGLHPARRRNTSKIRRPSRPFSRPVGPPGSVHIEALVRLNGCALKFVPGIAFAVGALLLFSSCSETGSSQTTSNRPKVQTIAKAKAQPKLKSTRKSRAMAIAEAKALSEVRSPRQCKTPKKECGYGAGPAGEICSCWSAEGAPELGVTVK